MSGTEVEQAMTRIRECLETVRLLTREVAAMREQLDNALAAAHREVDALVGEE